MAIQNFEQIQAENTQLRKIIQRCQKALLSCKTNISKYGRAQSYDNTLVTPALKEAEEIVIDTMTENMIDALDRVKFKARATDNG